MRTLLAAWDYCWALGVPGNLVASLICLLCAAVVGLRPLRRWLRRLEDHARMTRELHALMHAVHADKAAELGHTVPPTEGRR